MTLLEYGLTTKVSRFLQNEHVSTTNYEVPTSRSVGNLAVDAKSFIDEIMQDMSEIKDVTSYLSKNKIGSIVSLHKDSISQYSQNYTALKTRHSRLFGQTNVRIVASLVKQMGIQEKNLHKFTLLFDEINNILGLRKNELLLASKDEEMLEISLKVQMKRESNIDKHLLQRYILKYVKYSKFLIKSYFI